MLLSVERCVFARMLAVVSVLTVLAWVGGASVAGDSTPFDAEHWVLDGADVTTRLGRQCVQGSAILRDVLFEDGTIEVDIAMDGRRSYPGVLFRLESATEHERVYLRPHRAGLYPDAVQYTPVFNGVAGWQLYHGPGCTAGADLPRDEWVHLKVEVRGTQAHVFLGEPKASGTPKQPDDLGDAGESGATGDPVLIITNLRHGRTRGAIGLLGPRDGSAYFSNFRYRAADAAESPADASASPETPAAGVLTNWQVTEPFAAAGQDTTQYPSFFAIFGTKWQTLASEPSGLVDLARFVRPRGQGPDCVMARTVFNVAAPQDVRLTFGYSDDVTVFLNGRPVYSGRSGYRSRDASFLGLVGPFDTVYLPLEPGLNELALMVTDAFGGWGYTCQTDRVLAEPVKTHGQITKAWETDAVFQVPESVLYDAARDVLYVSSYNKLGRGKDHAGFISRLTPTGDVTDLKWIEGLDGPCGLGLHEDTLYVTESSGNVVAIDVLAGAIKARYPAPGSSFLNDLVVTPAGQVYVTNGSKKPTGADLYTLRGETCEVWLKGAEMQRANGLLLDGDDLMVGNPGRLYRVSLQDGRVSLIAQLGARIVDGIRSDGAGNYLVSHWEGQLYRVSPGGEVVELLDTQAEGLNCADFEYIADRNLVVIPTFMGNRVVAYRLTP